MQANNGKGMSANGLREERRQALLGLEGTVQVCSSHGPGGPCPVFGLAANHDFAEHLLSSGAAVFGSCAGVAWDMRRVSW